MPIPPPAEDDGSRVSEVLRNEQRRERTSRRSRVWVRVNSGGLGVVCRAEGGV